MKSGGEKDKNPSVGIVVFDPPEHCGMILFWTKSAQHNRLVADQSTTLVYRMRVPLLKRDVLFVRVTKQALRVCSV